MVIDPNRVKEIFLEAAELPDEAARTAYLDRACGGDAGLRARVEALLHSHHPDGSFLGTLAAVIPDPAQAGTMAFEPSDRDRGLPRPDHDDESEGLPFLTTSTRPDSLGRLGHYEVLQVLGRGGFGIVFRAFDDMLQRVVAVKVLAPQIAALSPARRRFVREARSSAAVRHENVVHVYEVGEQPLPYLVMEFIPGETLQQKLDRSGPLDVPEVLRIGRQIAEGLAAAHACDLIHRDIKPGNVLLEGGSHKAKITDFGLARAADDASISQSGIIAGTPMFMAPEQALGHKIDQRADLFSLGSVLYQMASGRPPFRASSALAVLKRVAEEPPRPIQEIIPETPDWLCGIIAKLHAKNPDDRFQSAREVADLLADCEAKLKAKQAVKNVLPAVKPAAQTTSARRKWVAAAAVLLFSAIALAQMEFAGVPLLFWGQPVRHDTEPVLVAVVKQEPPPLADGWVRLFNGKDKSGWKTRPEAPGHWEVKDGILMGSRLPSVLYSERGDYANFHLRVETKVNLGGDSGVFFRVGFGTPMKNEAQQFGPDDGFEVEILKTKYARKTGSVTAVQNGPPVVLGLTSDDSLTQPNEWFTLEIIAEQDHFITKVNGKETANCRDPLNKLSSGHVGLQVWSPNTIVQFRKIEIKELTSSKSTLPPTFKNNIGMEFVKVPKGKSWLGGGKDKLGDKEVEIPADFYMGKYEVTQEEWQKVMGENPSHFSRTGEGKDAVKDISDADLKRFPVEQVSWDQCQLFVAKLNKLEKETGWVYRLPKEVEWEYACRGGPMSDKLGSAFDFYFAKPTNTLLPEQANFEYGKGLRRTCKVGLCEPNSLGFYDMHGNVWEWCDDTEKGADGASARVNRGGGWNCESESCRAVRRQPFGGTSPPSDRHNVLGLRVARVPTGAPSPEAKTPPTDPDRRAAEYVLSIGGTVRVVGQDRDIKAAVDLPREEFRLTMVILTDNKQVSDEGLAHFKDSKNLTDLQLPGTRVSDAGLAQFKDCKNLRNLNLGYTQVGDAGLANFKDCKNLTHLHLESTQVSDAGLAHHKDRKDLTYLSLYGTQVSDAGLVHLKDCKNLTWLTLQKTKVTAAGIDDLKKALPKCKIEWDGGVIEPMAAVAPPAPTIHDTWIKAVALLPLDEHAAALPAKLKERLPGFEDAMLRTIPSMAADRQAIMVAAWLRDRNPAFEGEVLHKIEGGINWQSDQAWPAAEFWERYDKGEFKK